MEEIGRGGGVKVLKVLSNETSCGDTDLNVLKYLTQLTWRAWKFRARICKTLWSQGIDFEESTPPAYVAWRAGTTKKVSVPAYQAGNRFLGSLKSLQIRAQRSYRGYVSTGP